MMGKTKGGPAPLNRSELLCCITNGANRGELTILPSVLCPTALLGGLVGEEESVVLLGDSLYLR